MGIRALNNGLNGFRTLKYGVLDEQEKSSETKTSPSQILPSTSSSSTNLNYKEEKKKKEIGKTEEDDTPSESEHNYIGQGEWEDDEPSYTTMATDEEAAYDDGSITI